MSVNLNKAKEILDRLKSDREKRESGGGNTAWAKITVGDNQFRILPPWPGSDFIMKEIWYHYIKRPDGSTHSVVCPLLMTDKPCPICEMSDALRQSTVPADKDAGYELRASSRWFVNVIDRRDEATGPKVLGISAKGIVEDIVAFLADPDYGNIADINGGTDIIVSRTGEKLQTKYKTHAKRSSSPLGTQDQVNAWVPAIKNLDKFVSIETYENLVRIMEGQEAVAEASAPLAEPSATVAVPVQQPVRAPVLQAPVAARPAPVRTPTPVQAPVAVTAPVTGVVAPVTPVAPVANADKNAEVVAKVRERIAALKAGKK